MCPRPRSDDDPLRRWTVRPVRAAVVQGVIWTAVGAFALALGKTSGAGDGTLWQMVVTVLLCYAVFSALMGIFATAWWRYTAACISVYLVAVVVLSLLASAVSSTGADTVIRSPGLYAACFVSFFMIVVVAGAVRRIGDFLDL